MSEPPSRATATVPASRVARRCSRFACVLGILFAIYAAYVGVACSSFGSLMGLFPPLYMKRGEYRPVVDAVLSGALAPDSLGVVRLPPDLSKATPRGEVMVDRRPGLTLILFPTFYGRGNDLQGYLYCSRPLTSLDWYSIDWGSGGVHEHIDVGPATMLSWWGGEGTWLKVGRRLD